MCGDLANFVISYIKRCISYIASGKVLAVFVVSRIFATNKP